MYQDCDLLVIGTSIDSHIAAVLDELPEGTRVARFNVDEFPSRSRLSIEFGSLSGPTVTLENESGAWDITSPRAAWFRRLGAPTLDPMVAERYRAFALGEVEHQLEGVLALITPQRWLNPFYSTRKAANKPYQLHRARLVGLTTPATLFSNDPRNAERWLHAHPGDAVAKSIHSPLIAGQRHGDKAFSFTNVLASADRSNLVDVAIAPVQFQPFIEKAYELRVTTVAGRHFAARIDTDLKGTANADWRDSDHRSSSISLPLAVGDLLSNLLRDLDLQYAASDFIVTSGGEHVFLEANPHGAWLWLEQTVDDYEVAREIAGYLVENSS